MGACVLFWISSAWGLFLRTTYAADASADDAVLLVAAFAVSAVLIVFTVILYKRGSINVQKMPNPSKQAMTDEQKLCALLPLISQVQTMHKSDRFGFDICPQNIRRDRRGIYHMKPGVQRGGTAVVRPGFSAPECYFPDRAVGPWTDVYALSALILWLIFDKTPVPAFERKEGEPAAVFPEQTKLLPLIEIVEKGLDMHSAQRPSVNALLVCIQTVCKKSESASDVSPSKTKRMRGAAAALLAIILLLGAALLVCEINYTQAMRYADTGAFAKSLFSLEGVPAFYRESGVLRSYVQAGMRLDDGSYDEAAQLFGAMGDYKDAPDMVTEARYRQAADVMADGALLDALRAYTDIHPYKDTDERLAQIRESIYQKALAAYQTGAYAEAISCFKSIPQYRESDSYATVCAILSLEDAVLTRTHYEQLLGSGIDLSDILLRDGLIGFFLEGTWQDEAGHAFTVGEDKSVITDIPWQRGRYYYWHNAVLIMNLSDGKDIETFRFTCIDINTITLYCCKNKKTYTLSRQRERL